MDAIRLKNVSFSYEDLATDKEDAPTEVISSLDLSVPDGQFLCVIGHSGGGKSTLLRLISGLALPSSGQVIIEGREASGPGLDRAMVFQDYSLFPWMRVKANVEFAIEQASKGLGRGLAKADIARIADAHLAHVDMLDAQNKYPYQLSGGMQQRVAIARALAMDTDIVLFDEPFGALDVRTRRSLQRLVSDLWARNDRARTAVFVTHDIPEAILLADRIIFVDDGRITADFDVDIPRPRDLEDLADDGRFKEFEKRLTDLFYESEKGEDGGVDRTRDALDDRRSSLAGIGGASGLW